MSRYNIAIILSLFLLFSIVFAEGETTTTVPETTTTAPATTTTVPATTTTTPQTTTTVPETTTTAPTTTIPQTTTTISNEPTTTTPQTTTTVPQQTDKCAGVSCEPSKFLCPDGYVQTCPNYCDPNTGACQKCTPDCSQHQSGGGWFCGDNRCDTNTGENKDICPVDCGGTSCPQEPQKPICPTGQSVRPIIENNCIYRYECYMPGQEMCAQVITYGMDGAGNCKEFGSSCLPPGWKKVDRCPRPGEGRAYCGNGICEIGEDQNNCHDDCGAKIKCPPSTQCPDGSTRKCYPVGNGCGCDSCGPPPGCHEEKDPSGFIRTVCASESRRVCPEIPQEVRIKCTDEGGIPTFNKDPSGCEVFDCRFAGQASVSPVSVFKQYQCPSRDEWESTSKKCANLGMRVVTVVEGGCNFPKCVQEEMNREECGLVSGPERQRIESECKSRGLGTISKFDDNGCQRIECGEQFDCPRDMPKQAYEKCNQNGGEMIVKRDERGCISFSNCVIRGDDTKIYVERSEKVPESTELLSIAFKLENLKIELDKLARQTDEIADYYKSVGSNEEHRFRRVSDMFEAAKDKVDEIKNKIKDRLKDITIDDMTEIRQDIKYIKDVMIKDIVYVMLSSSEDVQDIINSKPVDIAEESDLTDCGTDGMCFDRALRLCKQVSFRPEGKEGPIVKVMGLDGNACVMKVTIPEDQGPPAGMIPGINPPYEMKCRIEKYAMGVRNPDTDLIPYCEGNLKELMKYDKQRPEGSREGVGMCGDTICDDKEQMNPQSCPQDCGPLLSQPAQRLQPTRPVQPVSTQTATSANECPIVNELQCPAGKVRVARSGSSGCIIGYDCVSG